MNIKSYFEQAKAARLEHHKALKAKHAKLGQELAETNNKLNQQEFQLLKKRDQRAQVETAGCDSSKLLPQIKEFEAACATLTAERNRLQSALAECPPPAPPDFSEQDLFVFLLADRYGATDALEVESLREWLPTWPVKVQKWDSIGHITECSLATPLGSVTFAVKSSPVHFYTGFRPAQIEWLPRTGALESTSQPPNYTDITAKFHFAIFERQSSRFLLEKFPLVQTKRQLQEVRKLDQWGNSRVEKEWVVVKESLSDHFTAFAASLAQELRALSAGIIENGALTTSVQIDLEQDYADNPVLAHVRSSLLALTEQTPAFQPNTESLRSPEIFTRISPDWNALAACPWSADITGSLAMLKFLVENGEKARFWSTEWQNLYGFRLRTRDHTWVEGEIYITPDQPAASPHTIMIHTAKFRHNYEVATLGRMSLHCALTH